MLEASYRLNAPTCIAEEVDGDLIIIHLVSGCYYNLRGVSVRIWNAIIAGIPPQELMNANHWSDEDCSSFGQFLAFLLDNSLIATDSNGPNSATPADIVLSDQETPFHVDVFTDVVEMLRLDPIHEADNVLGWPHKAG